MIKSSGGLITWFFSLCLLLFPSCTDRNELESLQQELSQVRLRLGEVKPQLPKIENLLNESKKFSDRIQTLEQFKAFQKSLALAIDEIHLLMAESIMIREIFYESGTLDIIYSVPDRYQLKDMPALGYPPEGVKDLKYDIESPVEKGRWLCRLVATLAPEINIRFSTLFGEEFDREGECNSKKETDKEISVKEQLEEQIEDVKKRLIIFDQYKDMINDIGREIDKKKNQLAGLGGDLPLHVDSWQILQDMNNCLSNSRLKMVKNSITDTRQGPAWKYKTISLKIQGGIRQLIHFIFQLENCRNLYFVDLFYMNFRGKNVLTPIIFDIKVSVIFSLGKPEVEKKRGRRRRR